MIVAYPTTNLNTTQNDRNCSPPVSAELHPCVTGAAPHPFTPFVARIELQSGCNVVGEAGTEDRWKQWKCATPTPSGCELGWEELDKEVKGWKECDK